MTSNANCIAPMPCVGRDGGASSDDQLEDVKAKGPGEHHTLAELSLNHTNPLYQIEDAQLLPQESGQ